MTAAAALADHYELTHGGSSGEPRASNGNRDSTAVCNVESSGRHSKTFEAGVRGSSNVQEQENVCNYCHKSGH